MIKFSSAFFKRWWGYGGETPVTHNKQKNKGIVAHSLANAAARECAKDKVFGCSSQREKFSCATQKQKSPRQSLARGKYIIYNVGQRKQGNLKGRE